MTVSQTTAGMMKVSTLLVLQLYVFHINLEVGAIRVLGANVGGSSTMNTRNRFNNAACMNHNRCDQCIQTLGCMWCKDKKLSMESKHRCFANTTQPTRPIDCEAIENPQSSMLVKEQSTSTVSDTSVPQLKGEQVVQLKLRKGERTNITIEYTDEKHRPLDLYIVMDLSCSMKQHKEKVANLASSLAKNLGNLTRYLRIGFGSFVDKPLAPFGYLLEAQKCGEKNSTETAVPPYGFQNHLKLTKDINQFIEKVKSAGISSNIDSPEGTLDGLLQSIVCTKEIGWPEGKGNRKLVVISTDGSYHLAGDGKLVGVVLPHDGVCYVDSTTGMYTHSTILDYPSISVVRQRIRENDVFVIFAVTEDQRLNYNQLSQQLHPYAVTQGIDDEDNSITTVIENEYRTLVNTVTLVSEYNEDYVDVKLYSKCPGEKDFKVGYQCNGVELGKTVSYKIEVELKDCPSSSNRNLWQSNITVYPQSSGDERLSIKLNMLCGCDCENENPLGGKLNSTSTRNLEECSGHGFLQCGICKCDDNWGGPICNCTNVGEVIDKTACFNRDTEEICSGRGTCDSCGKCSCNPVGGDQNAYGGLYCECDNTDCQRDATDKGLCNQQADDGPQGFCQCSQCSCTGGFTGARCECPTSDEKCQDPKSPDKICNGYGECHCGKCVCGTSYKGAFCEIQHAQVTGSCDTIRAHTEKCIECLKDAGSDVTDESKKESCKEHCTNNNIFLDFKKKIDASLSDEESNNICLDTREDSKGCRVDFIIRERHIHNKTIFLEIETADTIRKEKCPIPVPLLEIGIGVASGMVLIGIMLLLLWKIVTYIQDKKEYARFEKSINEASWNMQNPLYKGTTSQFENPAYTDAQ